MGDKKRCLTSMGWWCSQQIITCFTIALINQVVLESRQPQLAHIRNKNALVNRCMFILEIQYRLLRIAAFTKIGCIGRTNAMWIIYRVKTNLFHPAKAIVIARLYRQAAQNIKNRQKQS